MMTRLKNRILSLVVVLVCTASWVVIPPLPTNAAATIGTKTHIIYITGTDFPDLLIIGAKAKTFQQNYQWIAKSLENAKRLNVSMGRQAVLNYTTSSTIAMPTNGSLPRVITSKGEFLLGRVGRNGPPSGCLKKDAGFFIDSWRFSYLVAWRIDKYIKDTGASNVLLVGHSQGGLIARTVQVVAAKKSGVSIPAFPSIATDLLSRTTENCWPPDLTAGKIAGIVTVGTPFSEACGKFPDDVFTDTREFLGRANASSIPGKSLVIGAAPEEQVFGEGVPIPLACATDIVGTGVTRAAIYSDGMNAPITNLVKIMPSADFPCSEGESFAEVKIEGGRPFLSRGMKFQVREHVPLDWVGTYKIKMVLAPNHFRFCLPKEKKGAPTQKLGTFKALTRQQHTWYIEGKGACPATVFRSAPVTGRPLEGWCGYKLQKAGYAWPKNWSFIYNKIPAADRSLPGSIYDLITNVVSGW